MEKSYAPALRLLPFHADFWVFILFTRLDLREKTENPNIEEMIFDIIPEGFHSPLRFLSLGRCPVNLSKENGDAVG